MHNYYYYYAAFNAPCVGHKADESQAQIMYNYQKLVAVRFSKINQHGKF